MLQKCKKITMLSFLLFAGCDSDDMPTMEPIVEASFSSNVMNILENDLVLFSDQSIASPESPNSWQWTFEGGTPTVSTEQNPIIRYASSGVFDVKLIASNTFVYDTLVLENYISVAESNSQPNVEYDILYGNNGSSHRLDLFHPYEMDTIVPLVIVLGGNFSSGGNRNNLVPIAQVLNQKGIAVAATSYRKVAAFQGEGFAEALVKSQQDSKTAVKFFKAHSKQYSIDTSAIFIGGFSNGATAALNHAIWDLEEFSDEEISQFLAPYGGLDKDQGWDSYSSEVAGVISLAGVFYSNSFPENYVDENDPPFFGVCVQNDPEVTCGEGTTPGGSNIHGAIPLQEAHQKVGTLSEVFLYESGDHTLPRTRPEDYVEELLQWINVALD